MSIPTRLLRPIVAEYVEKQTEDDPREALALRAGVSRSLVDKLLSPAAPSDYVEFPAADRLICAMGNVFVWYLGELGEVYWKARIRETKAMSPICEARGCGNPVPPKTHTGGKPRRFCSTQCAKRTWDRNKDGTKRTIEEARYDKCPHGHDRSPENTGYYKGSPYCRVCDRERKKNNLEYRKRDAERKRLKREAARQAA